MYYYHFYISTPYAGTEEEYWKVSPDEISEDELENYFIDLVFDLAETYSYLYTGWGSEDENEEWVNKCFEDSYWDESTEEEYKKYCAKWN